MIDAEELDGYTKQIVKNIEDFEADNCLANAKKLLLDMSMLRVFVGNEFFESLPAFRHYEKEALKIVEPKEAK